MVKGLYVTRKKAQKGQVKMRFEVIPFKFVTGKYCLKYTWRANSLPPLPHLRCKTLKRSKELLCWLGGSNDGFSDATEEQDLWAKRRALPRPCTVSADRRSIWDLYRHWVTAGKTEDIEVKANSVFIYFIVRSCANRSIMYLIERAILGDILPEFQDIEIHHVLHMFSSWVH